MELGYHNPHSALTTGHSFRRQGLPKGRQLREKVFRIASAAKARGGGRWLEFCHASAKVGVLREFFAREVRGMCH